MKKTAVLLLAIACLVDLAFIGWLFVQEANDTQTVLHWMLTRL